MKIEFVDGAVLVSRPQGAPRIPKESTFWYHLQRTLNHDRIVERWVRIRPHKEALTSMPFALRLGDRPSARHVLIYDAHYALRDPAKQYNDGLTVRLSRGTFTEE